MSEEEDRTKIERDRYRAALEGIAGTYQAEGNSAAGHERCIYIARCALNPEAPVMSERGA